MYLLQLIALKRISAFTVNLSYNLEPVYSILIAMVLFDEARELNASFWAGLALIGLSVLLQTVSVLRQRSPLTLKEREFRHNKDQLNVRKALPEEHLRRPLE